MAKKPHQPKPKANPHASSPPSLQNQTKLNHLERRNIKPSYPETEFGPADLLAICKFELDLHVP